MKVRLSLIMALLTVGFSNVSVAAPLRGPETWLEFMGGNVRKDGLRCDLEAIRDAGISGVQFFHVQREDVGVWRGCEDQVSCLSEKWFDVVGFLGDECRRLGLALTVQNCPGWSQSGGPWVDLDHCQRDLMMARGFLKGGERLRLPEIPEDCRSKDADWREVAVLAFPTPKGDGPNDELIPDSVTTNGTERILRYKQPVTVRTMVLPGVRNFIEDHCYQKHWLYVKLEAAQADGSFRTVLDTELPASNWRDYVFTLSLACDETTSATWRYTLTHKLPIKRSFNPRLFVSSRMTDWEGQSARTLRSLPSPWTARQNAACFVPLASVLDVTDQPNWVAPAGDWTILRLGHVNSRHVNAPAPAEATGWECDKLDPIGIEACFNGYIGKLNNGVLKGKMRAMLVDSWECFGQGWTKKMEQYFFDANGYRLRRWIPALFGWIVDSPAATEKFLADWRRTNGDLITKNYYGHMAELARAAGLEVYYETAFGDIIYGDLLEYWKYADAPMCEYWYPHAERSIGSVGTYAFKPIRPCASAAHVYGKNRVVAEAFTGMGIRWNEDFKRLRDDANRHFARGVTHLAFQSYTHAPCPDDLPPGGCMGGCNGTPFTRLQTWWKSMPEFTGWLTRCEERLEAGVPAEDVLWYLGDAVDHKPEEDYAFPEGFRADYVNHDVLTNRLTVKDGYFAIPEGARWKILWVPDERFLLPASDRALKRLAAAGGTVVRGDRAALDRALAELRKDVATEPALGDEPSEDFMWFHRTEGAVERYFVAAGTNGYRGKVTFRAKGPASIYDPVTEERRVWENGTPFELPPSGSVFVEFGANAPVRAPVALPKDCASLEITDWTLSFTPGWGAPEKVTLKRPVSWTEIPGFSREAQAYGGTVVYTANFDLPAEAAGNAPSPCLLDLSFVESMAKVFVNGREVRTLWCEPYRCDIAKFVRPGKNELRLEVTNTWRNRVIYDLGQPKERRKTWIIYNDWGNPGPTDPLLPSGILGRVHLEYSRK